MAKEMVAHTTTSGSGHRWEISLSHAKTWGSFEQFRADGATRLRECITDGRVGFLRVQDMEYAIFPRRDFSQLVGCAQDVRRMSRGIVLMTQAAELVVKSPEKELAVRHLEELSISFDLPTTGPADFIDFEIEAEPDDSIDLATYAPPRATLATAG